MEGTDWSGDGRDDRDWRRHKSGRMSGQAKLGVMGLGEREELGGSEV